MNDLMELALHIDMEVVETHQRAEAEGWTFYTVPADVDHWASMGITTVAEYEAQRTLDAFSDWYKEKWGSRPRGRYTAAEAADIMARDAEIERDAEIVRKGLARARAEMRRKNKEAATRNNQLELALRAVLCVD